MPRRKGSSTPITLNPHVVATVTDLLENVYSYYHKGEFIGTDPIKYPWNAQKKGQPNHEVEYMAFVSAMFAYGNVKAIQGFLERLFDEHGTDPFKITKDTAKLHNTNLYYRFQSSGDVAGVVALIARAYDRYGSLQGLMNSQMNSQGSGVAGTAAGNSVDAAQFALMKQGFNNHFRGGTPLTSGIKMMFADVDKSAAKRLSMFLRWMIRHDEIDMGLWGNYAPEVLTIPLDVHITQFAQRVNLIQNSNANKGNMIAVTNFFRQISPQDPAKYDFSLTRPGIIRGCTFTLDKKVCYNCPQHSICKLI